MKMHGEEWLIYDDHVHIRSPPDRGSKEPLLSCSVTLLGTLARDPTATMGHRADCSGGRGGAAQHYAISACLPQASTGDCETTVELLGTTQLGTTRLGIADCRLSRDACSVGAAGVICRSKHLKAMGCGLGSDGAAGRTGQRSCVTSEAGHMDVTVG